MAVVTRRFKMDEKLLFDTIQRQAGTFEKANLEGVMNSIEAGATLVIVGLNISGPTAIMTITDDGKGFRDRQEIEDFFETFGKPHQDNEKVIWKQFRMGRGQLFAYGRNIWRTGTFRMIVDIKKWGLNYEFEDGLPFHDGCKITIELYDNPIGRYPYNSMEAYKTAIQKQVRFVEIPVLFNDIQINTPPSECTWDKTDRKSYYLFNVGMDMLIYNLGVFVMKIPASVAGMGGVVVSRKQLLVNFARNDVDSKCVIMEHINGVIRQNRIKKTRQRRHTLTVFEKQATLTDLRDETQKFETVKMLALIPTAQGKHVSLEHIRKNKQQWSFAEYGDRLADRMMEREQALIIDESILLQLNYDGDKRSFFTWLTGNQTPYAYGQDAWLLLEKLYVDFDELSKDVSDDYTTLPDKKLTVSERRIIKVLNGFLCWNGRVINLGYSARADAWTDGTTYITLDRGFLKRLYLGGGVGVNRLMWVMAHEMAHDIDTRCTHLHGPEFYENMVNIMGSSKSPTINNARFYYMMGQSKIEDKRAKEQAKINKAESKIRKKLGIAASTN